MSIEVPKYLQQGAIGEAAAKALGDTASMASSSMSIPRISLRGREFRLIESGEEVRKVRDQIDFIILGVEPDAGRMIKTFYAKGYTPGAKEPPTCSSDDGISPSPWVTEKQSPNCGQCKWNAFGSAKSPTGKATKACRDSKRIWIAMADDPKPIPERTLYGLNVTVASLKSFAEHGRFLQGVGQPPAVAITRAKMLDTEFPQLEFSLAGWVTVEEAPLSLELAERRPWKAMSGAALALAMSGGAETSGGPAVTLPGMSAQDAMPTAPAKQVGNIDQALKDW